MDDSGSSRLPWRTGSCSDGIHRNNDGISVVLTGRARHRSCACQHDLQCGAGFGDAFFCAVAWHGNDDDGFGRNGMYFSDGNYIVRKGVTNEEKMVA